MLACSPKSAGRGRFELESRVSSAGRAVYHPNAKGLDAYICTYGRLVPLRVPRQVETAWSRLVRGVRLAPDRSPGLRGGMRRMGATCTAAQTHMHSHRISSQEFDRNGAKSGGVDALPSEFMASVASQRATARVAVCGSAKFRLLTCQCDGRHQHTISAQTCAIF